MKRFVAVTLLIGVAAVWPASARAQDPGTVAYARETNKLAAKQMKKQKKAAKKQQKAMNKYIKAQQKAAQKAKRNSTYHPSIAG